MNRPTVIHAPREFLASGALGVALILTFSLLPLMAQKSPYKNIPNLDLESARDWVDINRDILNHPRVDDQTRARMLSELQALRSRLKSLKDGLGDNEVDRVNKMRMTHSLRDVDRLLAAAGNKTSPLKSGAPAKSNLPPKHRLDRQLDHYDKLAATPAATPSAKSAARSHLEWLRDQVGKEMIAANRRGDKAEAGRLVDLHRRLASQISKLGQKTPTEGGTQPVADTANTPAQGSKLPPAEAEPGAPRPSMHLDAQASTPVPEGNPARPPSTDANGNVHSTFANSDETTTELFNRPDGSSLTIHAQPIGDTGERITFTERNAQGQVTTIETVQNGLGLQSLMRTELHPDGTRTTSEWPNGNEAQRPRRVTTTSPDGMVNTELSTWDVVDTQITTSPNGYETVWRRREDGSTSTTDRDSDGNTYRTVTHSPDGTSTVTETEYDRKGHQTAQRTHSYTRPQTTQR